MNLLFYLVRRLCALAPIPCCLSPISNKIGCEPCLQLSVAGSPFSRPRNDHARHAHGDAADNEDLAPRCLLNSVLKIWRAPVRGRKVALHEIPDPREDPESRSPNLEPYTTKGTL